jgi:hypothetical protein
MTDLSLAAMAVLDAFSNASDGEYIEGEWIVDERTMLAAALRAAAQQIIEEIEPVEALINIATELESLPNV